MEVPDAPPPYRTIVFDCDSTLSAMEGIEELAGEHAAELVRLTDLAMEGKIPLEQAYGRRLDLARPTRADIDRIGEAYVEHVVPGAVELVAALHSLGKRVVVVSGGLRPAVRHLARHLGIPDELVEAVGVSFDDAGAYTGFEADSPLARGGGKPEVLARLREEHDLGPTVLVGDGATDLETAPMVDRFVAYGGVDRRAAVFAAARVTCAERDFHALVPLLLAPGEIAALSADPPHADWIRSPR